MDRNRRPLLSDKAKIRLAQAEGAGDRIQPGDYGNLTSREAGNIVRDAIAVAEQSMADQPGGS